MLSAREALPGRSTCSSRVVSVVTKNVSLAIAMLIGPLSACDVGVALRALGRLHVEIIDRGALKLAFLGRGPGDLEEPGERVLERLGVFQSDAQQASAGCLP